MQFEKKNTCVFSKKKTCFFREKNLASKKKKKTLKKCFFFKYSFKKDLVIFSTLFSEGGKKITKSFIEVNADLKYLYSFKRNYKLTVA